jgi:hypothetical protein
MNVSMNSSASPAKLLALAVSEWLLVLPASVLVLAALLRLVQPREREPARASWVIFAWARTHISQSGAGLVFIGLPGVAAFAGSVALLLVWRRNEALRQDLTKCRTSEPSAAFRRSDSRNGNGRRRSDSCRGACSPHSGLTPGEGPANGAFPYLRGHAV